MTFSKLTSLLGAGVLLAAVSSAHALVITATNNADELTEAVKGNGISISNTYLAAATETGAGVFTGGASAVGFEKGILLTTGSVNCAQGQNDQTACTGEGAEGDGMTTHLAFDFVSDTGDVYFKYVFASEEYNDYVNMGFNDRFELRLNGENIAFLPSGYDVVSIDTVNNGSNATLFRDNTNMSFDIQYNGLTTVLVAQATGLLGLNTFEFLIYDRGDSSLDSGVFIEMGSFSSAPTDPTDPVAVPEPTGLTLFGLGLLGLAFSRRKKS